MDEDRSIKVTPAITIEPPTQLSAQEFQRMLYSWYEEKGLVSDLRSYLRVLMISKLRNTQVGKFEQKPNFSLTKQAFSLVIAEYLLRENCHYTLSIFSTEVPAVANHLPFSLFEAHMKTENLWKFDEESVLNVLELMGISKNTSESQRIVDLYFNNYGSLLTCIISSKKTKKIKTDICAQENETIESFLRRALTGVGLSDRLINELVEKIQTNIKAEKERNAWEIGNHFSAQIDEIHAKIDEKDREIQRLTAENLQLRKDNKLLKKDIKEKSTQLAEKDENMREEISKEKLEIMEKLEDFKKQQLSFKCEQKHCSQTCDIITQENLSLKNQVISLQSEVSEKIADFARLQTNINTLSKALSASEMKINFLQSCLQRSNQINLKPEEIIAQSSEESSENITEEVLKQARLKLNELERESEELDGRYRRLQLK